MEDAADLGLSIFEKGIDKYHDKAYDGVTHGAEKVRGKKHRKYTEETLEHGGVRTTAEETTHYYPPEENDYRDSSAPRNSERSNQHRYYPESQYSQPAYQPGTYQPYQATHSSRAMAEKDNYDDAYSQRGGYRQDGYDPNIGSARGVGRDGYAAYPEEYDARSGYDDDYRRSTAKSRGPRYLEYAPDGSRYGGGSDQRHKSYDDLRSSRGGGGGGGGGGYNDDEYSSYDEEEDSRDRRRDRRRSRSKSRSGNGNKQLSAFQKPGAEEDNPKWQEWGATVAGAAVGAYGVHRGMGRHSNGKGYGGGQEWLPAVVGAVVGGLVARGAEKEWKKRSERGRELDERLEKVSYRSKSR